MKIMATTGKGSKIKGSDYENKVAKLLTEWWGEGKFSRVPASGGLHWGDDQRVAGDIVPPANANFPFVVECKKREEWSMEHVLLDIGQPREWWSQVVMDARRIKKVPLLIFSRNRAKDFVMLPHNHELYDALFMINKDVMRTPVSIANIRGEIQTFEVNITTFESLSQLDPEILKRYAEIPWDPYTHFNF
jgi:hypothetical protein